MLYLEGNLLGLSQKIDLLEFRAHGYVAELCISHESFDVCLGACLVPLSFVQERSTLLLVSLNDGNSHPFSKIWQCMDSK